MNIICFNQFCSLLFSLPPPVFPATSMCSFKNSLSLFGMYVCGHSTIHWSLGTLSGDASTEELPMAKSSLRFHELYLNLCPNLAGWFLLLYMRLNLRLLEFHWVILVLLVRGIYKASIYYLTFIEEIPDSLHIAIPICALFILTQLIYVVSYFLETNTYLIVVNLNSKDLIQDLFSLVICVCYSIKQFHFWNIELQPTESFTVLSTKLTLSVLPLWDLYTILLLVF